MQVQIKRRFVLIMDEDEAEEFLTDASDAQARVRAQMYGHNDGTQARAASPAPAKRGRPTKDVALPKAKRRAPQPVTCPDCGKTMDPRTLHLHRRRAHGSSAVAQDADEASAE